MNRFDTFNEFPINLLKIETYLLGSSGIRLNSNIRQAMFVY